MKPRFLVLLVSVLLGLIVLPVAAQDATIRGTVRAADGGGPLGGANVIARAPGTTAMLAGTATDAEGRYALTVAPGTYEIVARFVGFSDGTETVTVAAGADRTVDFSLESSDVTLNPVVITASRQQEKVLDAPASISVLSARELERDAVPNPAMSLRHTPGVDIARVGVDRYQVTMRGFNEVFVARTYILVDHRQGVTPSLGANVFGSMPISPLDLAQVEVVRGPGSALYGPGVEQGVIHFITKDPLTFPGTSVMIGAGERSVFQGSVRHAGNLQGRFGYKVVGYYSRANDWPFDPDDPADLDILCAIAPRDGSPGSDCVRDAAGNVTAVNALAERDDEAWSGYGTGTLQYRVNPSTTATLMGGYSLVKQVNLANTGENQVDNFAGIFTQLRIQAGNFFGQAYLNQLDAGDTYIVRSGNDIIDNSTQFTAQGQYRLDLLEGRQGFTVGADYKVTTPKTEGTVHGRNEEIDQLIETGAYLQSETSLTPKLDLVVTGRLDRDNVIEKTQLSPRFGVVFKPDPLNSIRATYNRAFTTPAGVNLFLDLVVAPPAANSGLFGIRARGAFEPFTFNDDVVSLVPSLAAALAPLGVPSRVPLGQLPLAGLYGYGLGIANATGQLDQLLTGLGITGTQALQVKGALAGAAVRIPGAVGGTLLINGEPVTPQATPSIEQTITNTVEVGYKGVLSEQFLVGVDVYYTQKNNFLSGLQIITPIVVAGADGGAALGAALPGAVGADLAALGLSTEQIGALFTAIATVAARTPYGIVEPDQNVLQAGGAPEIMLTYLNFGEVEYYGADLALEWRPDDRLRLFGTYSWVSDDFFDAEELGEPGTGRVVSLNAARNKGGGGAEFRSPVGWSLSAAARYTDAFDVRSGIYTGTVDSYFLLDLGAGFDFARYAPGLRLNVLAHNVLDEQHREYVGGPRLGRLVTARLTYTLP